MADNPMDVLRSAPQRVAAMKDEKEWGPLLREQGPHVVRLLKDVVNTYMDMDPDDVDILVAWILAAAVKDGFMTMPILYIHASRGSGKSRLLSLIEAVLPESVKIIDVTESALFRLAGMKKCVILDEAEKDKISNKDKVNITELLNSCYKRGGVVVRVEKRGGKGETGYVPVEYPVFVPVALANTFGLAGIIEDRSITVVLGKTKRQDIIRTPEYFKYDPVIAAIRAWFVQVSVYVCGFLEHTYTQCMTAHYLYNNKYNIYTYPTSTYTNSDVNEFIKKSEGLYVGGRDLELWMPLLEITYTIDPPAMDRLLEVARERIKSRSEEGAEFDMDTTVSIYFYKYLNDRESCELYPKDFRNWYIAQLDLADADKKKFWMSPEWVGHFLKRLKVINSKKRTGQGILYSISKARTKSYLDARDVLSEADAGKLPDPVIPASVQKTIKKAVEDTDAPVIKYLKRHGGECDRVDLIRELGQEIAPDIDNHVKFGDVFEVKKGHYRLVGVGDGQ